MSNAHGKKNAEPLAQTREFLTFMMGDQMFGIPILQVQDVLGPQKITRIPLAPAAIAGSLNLRGRIVTAINMRACLSMPPQEETERGRGMSVVVENHGDLYSLIIDKVGDVLGVADGDFEKNPGTLDPQWRGICQGIYRLQDRLLIILDVPRLLEGLE